MSVRLIVSTLIPPTSPGFGIIVQAATPDAQKWTAMPFFLLASTVAGACPWLLDKLLQFPRYKDPQQDFKFTKRAQTFTSVWPLTCWTFPVMTKVFGVARLQQI